MESLTSGVQTLLGDPKRAVLRLSLPMMAAMFVQSLHNIVDAIWIAGLGSAALAAVGLFFPFMAGMTALATGLGVGGSSAVSRRIGACDKEAAERAVLLTLSFGPAPTFGSPCESFVGIPLWFGRSSRWACRLRCLSFPWLSRCSR